MPSTREIRRRIRSARNIAQITRAMEMVAASRMRRAQQAVLAGRPYAQKIGEVIQHLAARLEGVDAEEIHPLLRPRAIKSALVIMFTADKGLAGALNTNLIRRTTRFIVNEAGVPISMVAVGRKGRDFMVRYGRPLVAEFTGLGDQPSMSEVYAIARVATEEYLSGRVDAVYLIYTDFVNTLVQKPTVYRLAPVNVLEEGEGGARPGENVGEGSDAADGADYIYEPGVQQVLDQLVPRYIEVRIFQALLEHIASEQSARMVAMRNATQNAKEMISDLTLAYNKLRQANITREIIEVSSGASAQTG